jgi:hypothetical protein
VRTSLRFQGRAERAGPQLAADLGKRGAKNPLTECDATPAVTKAAFRGGLRAWARRPRGSAHRQGSAAMISAGRANCKSGPSSRRSIVKPGKNGQERRLNQRGVANPRRSDAPKFLTVISESDG